MNVSQPALFDNIVSLPIGRYQVSVSKAGGRYRFDIPNTGTIVSDTQGNLLETRLDFGASADILQDALTGSILPLLWTLRGGFLLHASAVFTPYGAVLFFGPSGAGKSTLAASFESRAGCRVLDDDGAFLERTAGGLQVHPTERGVSLWHDSLAAVGSEFPQTRRLPAYGTKYRARREISASDLVWPMPGSSHGIPVAAAFHLPRPSGEEVSVTAEPMTAPDKHLRLARSFQRLDVTDRDFLKRQFGFVSQFIAAVPLRRLCYPRVYSCLPDVQLTVLSYAARGAARE